MSRGRAVLLALGLAATLGALPAAAGDTPFGASAAQGAQPKRMPAISLPSGHITNVELRGSHGYDVLVSTNMAGAVTVEASKGGSHTEYTTAGRPKGNFGARARFRGLGTVVFDFKPTGRPRPQQPVFPGCKARTTAQRGIVRGRIEFTAERGFTTVSVRRARAELIRWAPLRCSFRFPPNSDGASQARFFAVSRDRPSVGLSASRYGPKARPRERRVQFEANAEERRRGVRILRTATVAAAPETFRQPELEHVPEHLVLTPPAPFSGSASFRRTPESTYAWTGTLAVEFPGTDPISLAGPRFTAAFCALRGCAAKDLGALFGAYGA